MGMTVITYGGSEILQCVFNAMAMLMKEGGIIRPLMIVCASVGCVCAAAMAFYAHSFLAFVKSYIFPLMAISFVFLMPSSPVRIEDLLKDRCYRVDHVPFLLAKFAELTSTIGHSITKAFESVMHVPNDMSYNKTGMIFGAENALEINRYEITNANLEQNLKRFCHHCMLYDVSLGRYSLNDLKTSTDLWKFLGEKTSKVRNMQYIALDAKEGKHETSYVSCKAAIKNMTPYFEKEKKFYANQEVIKNLPLTFQAITGIQKQKEELISQQLMMNLLSKEFGGEELAKSRAYTQQKSTAWILGSLASNSLVTLRGVLEALIYASFILIFPLACLPKGLKYITTWAGLVIWIQLWPPFYAILNYIMQIVAHGYTTSMFGGLNEIEGLSFFSSIGIRKLQEDIFAVSGCLAASIPFITYAILKGGVSSFVHLASSMMSPAHSAAAASASEQATGNFSYANASLGQVSYQNTTGLQTNLAPSLTRGFFHENTGSSSAIYTGDEQILKQSNSELRTSIFSDDSISQSLQTSKLHAQSTAENAQRTYSESLASVSRNMADFSSHLANSENLSAGISSKEAFDNQEAGRYFQNAGETLGKQLGISSHAGTELALGAGSNTILIAKAAQNLGCNRDEAFNTLTNLVKSEEYQQNYQRIRDIATSENYSSLDDKGMRLAESVSQSYEQMHNSQQSYQIAESELNQISENATWAEQNSQTTRRSLNQDFVNWASKKLAHEGGFGKVKDILDKGDLSSQGELLNEYISFMRTGEFEPKGYVDPQVAASKALPHELNSSELLNSVQNFLDSHTQKFNAQMDGSHLQEEFSHANFDHTQRLEGLSSNIETKRADAYRNLDMEAEKSLITRSLNLATNELRTHTNKLAPVLAKLGLDIPTEKVVSSNYQIKEQPFWMQQEDVR